MLKSICDLSILSVTLPAVDIITWPKNGLKKCYVMGQRSVMCCNVLGEATVTRISTLSGRGGRGDRKTCKKLQIKKINKTFSTFSFFHFEEKISH